MSNVAREAERSYNEGNYVRVMQLLQPLRNSGSRLDVASLTRLAMSMTKLHQYSGAVDILFELAKLEPARKLVFLRMALTLSHNLDDTPRVLSAARAILAAEPGNRDALVHYRHYVRRDLNLEESAASDAKTLAAFEADDAFVIGCELLHDHIMWCGDERLNFKIRSQDGKRFDPAARLLRRNRPHRFGERIRVGYFSSDLSEYHATLCLLNRAFDLHDPGRFDVRIYCHSPDGYVEPTQGFRTRNANRIFRIRDMGVEEAAAFVRSHELDIAIDLKGHTDNAWPDLFNQGLAPIQAAYLGFPGSGVGIDCDYIIGDKVVCPPESEAFFEEKFCWLPESYQVNDNFYRPRPQTMSRVELGLPEDKVIFMSANHIRKITLGTLDLWARVLRSVPDGVLWMICESETGRSNVLRLMAERGVAAERIFFAARTGVGPHLARLGAADIGLDTFPCNGHTTTSDKLWAGLPVVTRKGGNFSSRVSESLLRAVGLGALVAEDDDQFVEICESLAADPARRAALRAGLAAARDTAPLFDTERLVRHLEKAFEMMVERARNGLPPDHIAVPALPQRAG